MNKVILLIAGGGIVIGILAVVAISHNSDLGNMHMTTSSSTSSQQSAVATNSVAIQNFAFGPSDIKVKVGTTVTWANQDNVHHTITIDSGSSKGPKSGELGQNQKFNYTFNTIGTFTYHCEIHPSMHGTVTVTG